MTPYRARISNWFFVRLFWICLAYSGYVSFLIRAGSIPNSFGVKRSIPAYSVFGSRLGIDPCRSIPLFFLSYAPLYFKV